MRRIRVGYQEIMIIVEIIVDLLRDDFSLTSTRAGTDAALDGIYVELNIRLLVPNMVQPCLQCLDTVVVECLGSRHFARKQGQVLTRKVRVHAGVWWDGSLRDIVQIYRVVVALNQLRLECADLSFDSLSISCDVFVYNKIGFLQLISVLVLPDHCHCNRDRALRESRVAIDEGRILLIKTDFGPLWLQHVLPNYCHRFVRAWGGRTSTLLRHH